MKIAMGSDHAGFDLRRRIRDVLQEQGHEVVDLGTDSPESTDYPIYGARVGHMVADGECERGIVICGSGVGISIAASRIKGIRCVLCSEPYTARMSRRHNNANVLALGANVVAAELALMIVQEWLSEQFEGGRHERRVGLLDDISAGRPVE